MKHYLFAAVLICFTAVASICHARADYWARHGAYVSGEPKKPLSAEDQKKSKIQLKREQRAAKFMQEQAASNAVNSTSGNIPAE